MKDTYARSGRPRTRSGTCSTSCHLQGQGPPGWAFIPARVRTPMDTRRPDCCSTASDHPHAAQAQLHPAAAVPLRPDQTAHAPHGAQGAPAASLTAVRSPAKAQLGRSARWVPNSHRHKPTGSMSPDRGFSCWTQDHSACRASRAAVTAARGSGAAGSRVITKRDQRNPKAESPAGQT